ncbi:MAG: hypothetical protein Q4G43_17500 [Mobilicoccus sp.]|nr:hypothetical protein [Mobilicoccus sp.]
MTASLIGVAATPDIPLFGMGLIGVIVIGGLSFALGRAKRRARGRTRRRRGSLLRPTLD